MTKEELVERLERHPYGLIVIDKIIDRIAAEDGIMVLKSRVYDIIAEEMDVI